MRDRTLQWRVHACIGMAAVNLTALLLPKLSGTLYVCLLTVVLPLNVAVCWLALRKVPVARDLEAYNSLARFATRGTLVLGFGSIAGLLISIALATLDRQVAPFFLSACVFLKVGAKVLNDALDKRIEEFLHESEDVGGSRR